MYLNFIRKLIKKGENIIKKQDINDKQKNEKRISKITSEIKKIWSSTDESIPSDVDGSYTGNPKKSGNPVQDADDL